MFPEDAHEIPKDHPHGGIRPEWWILLATVVVGVPSLWLPLGMDHGNCGYVADVVLHGGAPYKDAWETRPPAIFYINAAAIALFGKTAFAFRLFDLLTQFATALALGRLARRFFGARPGLWAGVLFIAAYYIPVSYWDLANGDIYLVLPSALMLLCLMPERRGPRAAWDLLAGAMIGVVFWVRFTHGLAFLPAIAWILTHEAPTRPYGVAQRVARLAALGLGFIFVVGGYLALLAVQGALADFLYTVFDFDMHYAQTTYQDGARGFWRYAFFKHVVWVWRNLIVFVPAIFAAIRLVQKKCWESTTVVLMVWALSAYAGVFIMAKFFTYHWFPMLGPLSVLGGYGTAEILAKSPASWVRIGHRTSLVICGVLFMGAFTYQTLDRVSDGIGLLTGRLTWKAYWASFDNIKESESFSATANYVGGEYLRERTTPEDKVWIWSTQTLVLFNADRRGVGRFGTNLMLAPDWRRADWLEELHTLLKTERPKYAIVTFVDAGPPVTGDPWDSKKLLNRFPELSDHLATHYVLEKTIDNMEFHRLRTAEGEVVTAPVDPG